MTLTNCGVRVFFIDALGGAALLVKTKTWRKVPDIDISDDEFKEVVPLPDHFDTVVLGRQETACVHLANAMEAISRQGHMIKNMIARQGISEKMIQAPS
ncbi:hypothetical protein D5086_030368 [Populus alba]|uniref:Uncharacterized protein n=1 Tax=Populus alba TaxID=43335 RepID=A0ACC4ANC6_POPAL